MSYTLKKLKQSEVDHGYKKPAIPDNTKPSYGIFILCFVIILSILLVLLDQGKESPSQQQISSSKPIVNSFNKTQASSIAKKDLIKESSVIRNNESNVKVTQAEENKLKPTLSEKTGSPSNIINTPTKYIEPGQIAQIEEEPLIKSPVKLEDEPKESDTLTTNIDLQTAENDNNVLKDFGHIKSSRIENEFDVSNEDNAIQNDQPVLWQDLPASFQTSMPEMKLNGIVYLDKEEDRYIFINMTKYQIDDMVQETGPTVEEIKQHSVIMQYDNKLFILALNQ